LSVGSGIEGGEGAAEHTQLTRQLGNEGPSQVRSTGTQIEGRQGEG